MKVVAGAPLTHALDYKLYYKHRLIKGPAVDIKCSAFSFQGEQLLTHTAM